MNTSSENSKSSEAELISADDVLGKTVIDADGGIIGVAHQLLIDPKTFQLKGIAIDKGFLKKGLMIGRQHIQRVAKHALFLDIIPSLQVKGMSVYSANGKYLGKVKQVTLQSNSNKIERIKVHGKNDLDVEANEITEIGKSVFLKN